MLIKTVNRSSVTKDGRSVRACLAILACVSFTVAGCTPPEGSPSPNRSNRSRSSTSDSSTGRGESDPDEPTYATEPEPEEDSKSQESESESSEDSEDSDSDSDTKAAPRTKGRQESGGNQTLLRPGSSGPQVVSLQRQLMQSGYWVAGAGGQYQHSTTQAVMAVQKVAGLERDGIAGPKTLAALQEGRRPSARSQEGRVIEIDKGRQIVKVVEDGRVRWVFNSSTGSGERYLGQDKKYHIASTPSGSYQVGRQIRGWHEAPLGLLYSPKFFNGGIALHGSQSIPGYPASHGCARVSVAAMDYLWSSGLARTGTRVLVY